jgi:hypothetical protein
VCAKEKSHVSVPGSALLCLCYRQTSVLCQAAPTNMSVPKSSLRSVPGSAACVSMPQPGLMSVSGSTNLCQSQSQIPRLCQSAPTCVCAKTRPQVCTRQHLFATVTKRSFMSVPSRAHLLSMPHPAPGYVLGSTHLRL